MKSALLGVALAGLFVDTFLFRRFVSLALASAPLPSAIRPRPASLEPDVGFVRRLIAPAVPIIVPSLAAFPIFWFSQTYEEAVLGLLFVSLILSLGAPLLCSELILWGHSATRMPPEREADMLARLHRLGLPVSEAWISPMPVVAFWQPAVHLPAVVAGSRVLVWERLCEMDAPRLAGVALGRRAQFWAWGLWPIAAAFGVRALDPASVLPWWLFAVPLAVTVASAIPDVSRGLAIRNRMRSDSSAPEVITGFLEIELAGAAMIAARGAGPGHRAAASMAWTGAVWRARAFAARAGMKEQEIDAALIDVSLSPLAETV